MIVSLDELKRVLGIDLDDTSEDDNLTRIILAKTAWVEGETKRRFDTPIPRVEYHDEVGVCEIYLHGHVDDSPEGDNPSEWGDPATSVKVFARSKITRTDPWEALIEGTDWERRGDVLVSLSIWNGFYSWENEFRMEYLDGYASAPEDIKEVILELSMNQYLMDSSTSSGTAGIKSESLGDFSYTRDLSAVAAGTGDVSQNSLRTLNRYKRKLV